MHGRDKPGVAETADLLLRSAARIRLRPGRALSDRDGWRDALAMFSLAAPALVLASVCLTYLTTNLLSIHTEFGIPDAFMTPSTILGTYFGQASAIMWLVVAGQSLVVLLVLLGLRRCAAAASVLYLAVIIGLQEVQQPYTGLAILSGLFLLVLPAAEIVALLASPGPRRGRELLRRRHWALLAVGAVAAAAITGNYAFLSGTGGRLPDGGSWWSGNVTVVTSIHVTGAAVVVIVLLAVWLSSATGKRLAVLFAVLAYPGSGASAPPVRPGTALGAGYALLAVRRSQRGPRSAHRVRLRRGHLPGLAPGPVVRQQFGRRPGRTVAWPTAVHSAGSGAGRLHDGGLGCLIDTRAAGGFVVGVGSASRRAALSHRGPSAGLARRIRRAC